MFEGTEKVIIAIGTALAAVLAPIGVIYAASVNRVGKASENTVASLTAALERMTAAHDEAEKDRDAAREEAARERASGLRWYSLLMWWWTRAHQLRHAAGNARSVAESAARIGNLPQPEWREDLALPVDVEKIQPGDTLS